MRTMQKRMLVQISKAAIAPQFPGGKMLNRLAIVASMLLVISGFSGVVSAGSSASIVQKREKIIIDTDIGTDIDDAFAVALALRSPEFDILGIAAASGDTEARARMLDRMLGEVGRQDIPVAVGIQTPLPGGSTVNQRRYGEGGKFARPTHPNAVDFIFDQIQRHPGEITLVAIGPLTNLGGLIDRSPEVFRKVKRVVIMGGWFEAIKPDYGNTAAYEPAPEYNTLGDIGAAQKLFLSGVPLYVISLDSTIHLALDEVKRRLIFSQGTPLTDQLTLQYHHWNEGPVTPILYDAMTLAYMIDPSLCPVQPMHVRVDDSGQTRAEPGSPNAQVCLHSDADAFFRFYMIRLLGQ